MLTWLPASCRVNARVSPPLHDPQLDQPDRRLGYARSVRTPTSRPPLPDWHESQSDPYTPDRASVQAWLDAYVHAWQTYDPAEIADLWTDDSVWYTPFGIRARGREAITAEWLAEEHLDKGGAYDAHYAPIAIENGIVVTHGRTHFFDPATGATRIDYDNIWVLRFAPDGRCSEFHEWYAAPPDTPADAPS